MCGGTLCSLPWARVASFWLAFCFTLPLVPLTAQSTTPGPAPNESRQSILSLLNSQTETLVSRLTERDKQTSDSETNFRRIIEEWQTRWTDSVLALDSLQKEHEATLLLLSQSETAFSDYRLSTEDRAKLDNDAVALARKERDDARFVVWIAAATGFAIGIAIEETGRRLGWIR